MKSLRTKMPTVKARRGGGFDVVIACDGATRKHADRVAKMVRSYLRAYEQSRRGGIGAVRLNDMSDVLYALGLMLDMRMAPVEAAKGSLAGASVPAVDPSWSTPTDDAGTSDGSSSPAREPAG